MFVIRPAGSKVAKAQLAVGILLLFILFPVASLYVLFTIHVPFRKTPANFQKT